MMSGWGANGNGVQSKQASTVNADYHMETESREEVGGVKQEAATGTGEEEGHGFTEVVRPSYWGCN